MKLELKHLAPYLPYGFLYGIYENQKVIIRGMNYNMDYLNIDFEINDHNKVSTTCFFEEIKPILRPLSDLTKEIEHNGVKFVPIIELANSNYYIKGNIAPFFDRCKQVNEHNYLAYNSNIEISKYQFSIRTFDSNGENGDINFEYYNNENLTYNHFSTLKNINSLYEWHFDVFGLIEKGLAIDINTLSAS